MEFLGVLKKKHMEIPGGQLKKRWNFQGWSRKNHVECSRVLVFGVGISKGCNTILWNTQEWKFVFTGISKNKVTNLKIPAPGFFFKKISPQPPCCLDFFWNSPFCIWFLLAWRKVQYNYFKRNWLGNVNDVKAFRI